MKSSSSGKRIAFVSCYNPDDPETMSGIPFQMRRALEASSAGVTAYFPLRSRAYGRAERALARLRRVPGLAGADMESSHALCRRAARRLSGLIKRQSPDLVVCAYGHSLAAYLDVNCPVAYVSDSTYWLNTQNYVYAAEHGTGPQRRHHHMEQLAITRSALLAYPSRWAAQSALVDYGADPVKVKVIPFGANLSAPPDAEMCRRKFGSDACRLLYVGRDWQRKGGAIAVDTVRLLQEQSINAHLTIVGCEPSGVSGPHLTIIPSLRKGVAVEAAHLNALYAEARFFLLPTRAEAFGIVFAEASAFGLPSITTNVGGVPSAVENGVNGVCLSLEAGAREYAAVIADLFHDRAAYQALTLSTRRHYEAALNWTAWANALLGAVWPA